MSHDRGRGTGHPPKPLEEVAPAGRNSNGTLQPNPSLFPEGMKAFCDKIHAKGLKCGLYTGYAPMVCGFSECTLNAARGTQQPMQSRPLGH